MNINTFFGHRLWLFFMMATVWLLVSCGGSSSTSPQSQISKEVVFIKGLTLQGVDKENGRVTINWRMHRDEEGIDHTLSYKVYVATNDNGVWVEDSSSVSTWRIDGTGDVYPIVLDDVNELKAVDVRVPETNSLVSGTRYQVVVEARDVDDSVVARSSLNLVFSSTRLEVTDRPTEVIASNELDSTTMIVDWDSVVDAQGYVITVEDVSQDAGRLSEEVEVNTKVEVVCGEQDGFCGKGNIAKKTNDGKLQWEIEGLKLGSTYKVMVVPVVLEDLVGLQSVDEEGNEVSFEEGVKRLVLTPVEDIETKPGETVGKVAETDGVIPVKARVDAAARVDAEVDSSVVVYTLQVDKVDYPGTERPFVYRDVTIQSGGSVTVDPVTTVIADSSKISLRAEVISGGEGLTASINADNQLVLTSTGGEGEYEVEVTYEDANYKTDKKTYQVIVRGFTAVVSIAGLPDSGVVSYSVEGLRMTASVLFDPSSTNQLADFDPGAMVWSIAPVSAGYIEVDLVDKRISIFHITNAEVGSVAITAAVENYEQFKAVSNVTLEKATYVSGEEPIEYPATFTFRNNGTISKISTTADKRSRYFEKSLTINIASTGFTWSLNEDGSISVSSSESDGTQATIIVSYVDYNYVDHIETITVTAIDSRATIPVDSSTALVFAEHSVSGFRVDWTAATAGVKADGSTAAPITNYVVDWGTSDGDYTLGSVYMGGTSVFSYTVANLAAGTQYFVRVRAIADTDDGGKVYSEGLKGNTYTSGPAGAPTLFMAGVIESSSVTLSWVAPVDTGATSGGVAVLSGYKFEYKLTNSDTWTDISATTSGSGVRLSTDLSGDGGATGVTVEGLLGKTTYDFRISAKNNADLYGGSVSVQVSTISSATAPVDGGNALVFDEHQTSGFKVSWSTATAGMKIDGLTTAPITNYVVEWGTSSGSYTYMSNVGSGTTGYTITGLASGTQYFVRVRAVADNDDESKIYSAGKSGDTYVLSVPGVPTSFATGTVTATSIVFTWVAPGDAGKVSTGDATLSGYRFEYKLMNNNTWNDITSVTTGSGVRLSTDLSGDGGATGVTVEGLQGRTTYDFRISAKNSADLYGGSVSVQVSTISSATAPVDSGNALVFDEHQTSGFKVSWSAATAGVKADGLTTAPITNYVVEWGTTAGSYPNGGNAGVTTSYTITGLASGTQYFVRVRAIADNDDESKIYSAGKSGDTYVLSAPGVPTSFATGTVTATSIVFTWVAPGDAGTASTGDATLSGYRFEYKLMNNNTWNDITSVTTGSGVRLSSDLSVNSGATGVTVEGLQGRTTYDFRISAKNSVGLYGGETSTTVETVSGATAPVDSGNAIVFDEHQTSGFKVLWSAATAGVKADGLTTAPITNYVVEWGTSSGSYTYMSNVGSGTTGYTITGLASGTQYFVRVRAIADNDDESKLYSTGKSGDTYVLSVPGVPTSFATGTVTATSIVFTWVAPGDAGKVSTGDATLSGYRFEYKLMNNNTWNDITSVTTGSGVRLSTDLSGDGGATGVTVEGLQGRTTYDFRISAKNSADLYGGSVSVQVSTISSATAPVDSGNALVFDEHQTSGFKVSWSTATAGMKIDGLTTAPITNYVVEWGTSSGSYTYMSNVGSGTTGYTITGLASGTQYFVRVRAIADNDDESKLYSTGKSGDTYVLSVPGVPTSFATGTVTATSIVFTWVAPGDAGKVSTGDATLSGYRFEYKLMNNNTWNDITSVTTGSGVRLSTDLSGDGGATGVTVEGLQGRTTYDFRISAKNSADLYGGSVSVQVSTISSATAPVDSGNALVFDEHQTNGFKVSWSAATAGMKIDGLTTAPITNYVVEWGTSSGSYTYMSNVGSGTTGYTITGLASGTQYFVRVRAIADNDDESKIYSAGKSGDTYVLSAPGVPTSFATGTVTATSIVFTWVAPWDAGTTSTGDATLSGYKFEYQTNDDGDDTWNEITSATTGSGVRLSSDLSGDGGATGVTVEGLRGGTAYGFRIFAKNSADLYSKSASIDSVTTLSLATAPVDSGNALVFDEHQTNGFTVSWNAATPGVKADGSTTAPITNYVVEWGTTAGSYPDGGNAGVTTTSYTITGLASGTQYFVRVRAIADNDDESKLYSAGKSGDTYVLSTPGAPTTVTVSAGNEKVEVSWSAPSDKGIIDGNGTSGTVTEYAVYYDTVSIQVDADGRIPATTSATKVGVLNGTSKEVFDLANEIKYFFRVTAINTAGEGVASIQQEATPIKTDISTLTPVTYNRISAPEGEGINNISSPVWPTESPQADDLTYAVKTGTTLPTGITLDPNDGTITVTPTAGIQNLTAYTIIATAKSTSARFKGSKEITIEISVFKSFDNVTLGPFNANETDTGGTVPAGLTINNIELGGVTRVVFGSFSTITDPNRLWLYHDKANKKVYVAFVHLWDNNDINNGGDIKRWTVLQYTVQNDNTIQWTRETNYWIDMGNASWWSSFDPSTLVTETPQNTTTAPLTLDLTVNYR